MAAAKLPVYIHLQIHKKAKRSVQKKLSLVYRHKLHPFQQWVYHFDQKQQTQTKTQPARIEKLYKLI